MDSKNGRQIFPTIPQAFLNRVKTQPSKIVFHTKDGNSWKGVCWKEFYQNTRDISLGLQDLGVKSGDHVCILSNTRIEWLMADMAILGSGGVTVPIYGSNTAEDSAYILNHCEAKVLFVEDNKQLDKILSISNSVPKLQTIIVFQKAGSNGHHPGPSASQVLTLTVLKERGKKSKLDPMSFDQTLNAIKPSDVFTICYTSGTTGVPKGVVLTHDSLTSIVEDVEHAIGKHITEDDVLLSFLPVSHIFGKVESMAAYHFGWQVYFAESIEKLFLNISEVSPTIIFAVPRIFEKAYNRIKSSIDEASGFQKKAFDWAFQAGQTYFSKLWAGKRPSIRESLEYEIASRAVFNKILAKFGGRIRYCVAGGAPLPKEVGEFMRIVGMSVLEGYGLTETCAPVTLNIPEAMRFGTIGKPLAEVSIKIASDGEILVKSRKVFKEYYKNPEATREVLNQEHWFHTGDIGIIDSEGFVKITDRKKDLIVTSGGKNIAPQKIENLAKLHKYVSQFMVYGDRRNYLTALIVLEKEEVIKFAKEQNILFSQYTELVKNTKIQALVQGIIDDVNSKLASYETIKRFTILPQDFSIESGELTPSLKIRRRFCSEKYKSELDSMYGAVRGLGV